VGAAQAGLSATVKVPLSNLDVTLRVLAALLLGGVIGLEREVSHQPAGLRTHIGVALGAALFGIISIHGFDAYANTYQIDVTRVASQVVVGIGFLGGGTIIKQGANIRGLTTAASLWVTAAVGLASGLGILFAATITTFALLLSLVGLRVPRERIRARLARGRGVVILRLAPGASPGPVVEELYKLPNVVIRSVSVSRRGEGTTIEVDLVGPVGVGLPEVVAPVAQRDDVVEVDIA
jgi:putative Mg2+ transporter-C (MgtC) family protein